MTGALVVFPMPGQINGHLPLRPTPSSERPGSDGHDDVNGVTLHHSPASRKHKYTRSSYSDASPLVSRNNSLTFRPSKRQMPTPDKTIAVINASGRQAASFIRVATAVGYHVRAQLRNLEGVVATEVSTNPNVTVLVGELYIRHKPSPANSDVTQNGPLSGVGVNRDLIAELFRGSQLAFINTTFYGDEIQIGKALADEAKLAGVQHYIYSSMPDHKAYDSAWPSLPLWAAKHEVEKYVRDAGLPATFVYTGIYNNNFTSLAYPLFCMELQRNGSFTWQAPFHPDAKLPWLDAEHDVGPAILQIFKDGLRKWRGKRIALAYEMLTPLEACAVFAKGVGRPVRYVRGPIELNVKIPAGYREQLDALETLYALGKDDASKQPPYFGDSALEDSCPEQALALWEGPRGLEEYAREVFPLEEEANGLTWMRDDEEEEDGGQDSAFPSGITTPPPENDDHGNDEEDDDDDEDNDEGLTMRGLKRDEEDWLS